MSGKRLVAGKLSTLRQSLQVPMVKPDWLNHSSLGNTQLEAGRVNIIWRFAPATLVLHKQLLFCNRLTSKL
ncbi:hypothetical protein V2H77_15190 [Photorhabdus sp. P32]|uniref:hypothetical protein n=1 Tax=Photorhabdus sp. P32 TaxID=3117549 RepID=UPI00311B4198